ncbi:MAG: putative molybdenum carrier protein [Desulfobacterales bacterium]|nr:putative molybdenum carrier protein [Desulfobacterales bacterium]
MIVRRIISGGQSGVERAALDLAIQLGIAHGGWVAPGRLVDDGLLPDHYRLKEMAFADGPVSADPNIEMADGVLLMARGALTGESAAVHAQAQARQRPCLALDLDRYTRFQSSLLINSWLKSRRVEILFITGPREQDQPSIYRDTMECFRAAWWTLMMVEPGEIASAPGAVGAQPRSLEEAVERLQRELPLKDKVTIANMRADEITGLMPTLGRYIQKHFGIWEGNPDLTRSCILAADRRHLADEDIAALIIEHLVRELRRTHTLRLI